MLNIVASFLFPQVISMDQARLAYLTQMAELLSYSGRSYNATMLVRLDRLYCSFIGSKERGN